MAGGETYVRGVTYWRFYVTNYKINKFTTYVLEAN